MAGTNKLLIRGGQVYDHDGDVHHPPVADILIENDRIAAVGPRLATEDNLEIIEASGRLVVPGLINAHYHSHDTLCRGLFEELPLEMWLLYTLPMGQNRSVEKVRGCKMRRGGGRKWRFSSGGSLPLDDLSVTSNRDSSLATQRSSTQRFMNGPSPAGTRSAPQAWTIPIATNPC